MALGRARSSVAASTPVRSRRTRQHVAALVADEGVAVEILPAFVADPVGGDDGDDVGDGMADHRPAPQPRRVEIRVVRLGADRGRIKQDFGAHQHQAARGLGIPLVPANADAERSGRNRPGLEAAVSGPEVEFLRIAGPVRNVALAVDAHESALIVDHRQAVIMMRPVRLEEAGRDEDGKLGRELPHRQHGRVFVDRPGIGEHGLVLGAAEIGPSKSSGGSTTLAPLPAASRTSSETLAIFSSMRRKAS